MFEDIVRKIRQLAGDPVLRKWVMRRLTGATTGPPAFTAHRPPYLMDVPGPGGNPAPPESFKPLAAPAPAEPIDLPLPGGPLPLRPGGEAGLFGRSFADMETLLALHRFAWLPLVGKEGRASWAQALWDVWRQSHGKPETGWAWHPYTAAERAINILDLARTHGLPEPVDETIGLLARHAEAIYGGLEYFGEHNTSNHLSNNGRGLYRLGLELGLPWAAETGARILEKEAERIFRPSGVLGEGSSHYHFLLARNYADAWLAARAHGRAEEKTLRRIVERALGVVPWLILPGGLPLVGDISPDCPPEYLLGLAGAEIGWVAGLPRDRKKALLSLIADVRPAAADDLSRDGWLRLRHGPWSGLWHSAPKGWPEAPGHGHQDAGGFELHFQDLPVFVDPGRGAYGEDGDAAFYRSAGAHNTLTVSGADPYPANKPYYDDAFREAVAGGPPELTGGGDEVVLSHRGFGRIKGVGELRRQWRFIENTLVLSDGLAGEGRHRISRRFVTPLEAEAGSGGVVLRNGGKTFHLNSPDATAVVTQTTLWHAYGQGRPGFAIEFTVEAPLPWSGEVRLEVL